MLEGRKKIVCREYIGVKKFEGDSDRRSMDICNGGWDGLKSVEGVRRGEEVLMNS